MLKKTDKSLKYLIKKIKKIDKQQQKNTQKK